MDEPLPDNRFSRDRLPPSGAFQAHPPQPSQLAASADGDTRDESRRRSSRETRLTFLLVAVFAGSFVFFLNFVSLGIFFYVIVAVLAIVGVGFLHYVLWGYSLSQELAEQMHREQLKQQQEKDERL
jgi:Flp pilus assembly protein TadB